MFRISLPSVLEASDCVIEPIIMLIMAANYVNRRLFVDRAREKNAVHRGPIMIIKFSFNFKFWPGSIVERSIRIIFIAKRTRLPRIYKILIVRFYYFDRLFIQYLVTLLIRNNGDKRASCVAQILMRQIPVWTIIFK